MYHFTKDDEYEAISITFHAQSSDLKTIKQHLWDDHSLVLTAMDVKKIEDHPCFWKSIWAQPNTVIKWIKHNSLYQACNHMVPFVWVIKSSKGVIYEESLHRRSATTWLSHVCNIAWYWAVLYRDPIFPHIEIKESFSGFQYPFMTTWCSDIARN